MHVHRGVRGFACAQGCARSSVCNGLHVHRGVQGGRGVKGPVCAKRKGCARICRCKGLCGGSRVCKEVREGLRVQGLKGRATSAHIKGCVKAVRMKGKRCARLCLCKCVCKAQGACKDLHTKCSAKAAHAKGQRHARGVQGSCGGCTCKAKGACKAPPCKGYAPGPRVRKGTRCARAGGCCAACRGRAGTCRESERRARGVQGRSPIFIWKLLKECSLMYFICSMRCMA